MLFGTWSQLAHANDPSDYVENRLYRSQLQSDEEFTFQRSSHFKLCYTVNFKSLQEKIFPDLLFGTVMTKLKLFHVAEKMYHARQIEINCHL